MPTLQLILSEHQCRSKLCSSATCTLAYFYHYVSDSQSTNTASYTARASETQLNKFSSIFYKNSSLLLPLHKLHKSCTAALQTRQLNLPECQCHCRTKVLWHWHLGCPWIPPYLPADTSYPSLNRCKGWAGWGEGVRLPPVPLESPFPVTSFLFSSNFLIVRDPNIKGGGVLKLQYSWVFAENLLR